MDRVRRGVLLRRRVGDRRGRAVPPGEVGRSGPGAAGEFREGLRRVILLPAIDLRDGKCVRLVQGDFGRETTYDDDPVAVAQRSATLRSSDALLSGTETQWPWASTC